MRAALLLALLVAGVADARDRRCGKDRLNARTGDCVGYAFFEFAPSTGAGMPTACSTTAPTGARGETLTFTRTGNATCSKQGLATTGIANGDLVVLSGNQPRVELDSQGVLGLRVESSRTNILLQSEDLSSASWTALSTTVTSNFAVSPDGTSTAERLQMTGGSVASVHQTTASLTGPATHTFSVYLRANSGSPQVYCFLFQGAGTPNANAAVTLSTSSWTRCVVSLTTTATQTVRASIGWDTAIGMTNPGTVDLLAWGASFEQGASYATSYIPTTSAAAVRNAEAPTVNGSALLFPTSRYSLAASIQTLAPGSATRGFVEGQVGANSGVGFFTVSGFLRAQNLTAGADNTTDFAWTPNVSQLYRLVTLNNGTNQSTLIDGALVIGPVARTPPDSPWSTTTGIGYAPAFPAQLDGIISRVCLDPDPTRCR